MLKPEAFQQPFIALRNIPYLCGVPEDRDHSQGGVLCQGQKVWIQSDAVPDRKIKLEAAFVEEVGLVSLDPHWLVPAHFLTPRTKENIEMKTTKGRPKSEIDGRMGNLKPHSQAPTQQQVAQRAYERWEEGGCQPGMAELDWIRAEEDLTGAFL